MRRRKRAFLVGFAAFLGWLPSTMAEKVTQTEAHQIASNWVLQAAQQAVPEWKDVANPTVSSVVEFKRDNRVLGYYCDIDPNGFVLVSLIKGLRPVKAYSDSCRLDPLLNKGMVDVFKIKMEQMLNGLEGKSASLEDADLDDVTALVEVDSRSDWDRLTKDTVSFKEILRNELGAKNYAQGQILLWTTWHQDDPYNRQCPAASNGCTEPRCSVGCVATAGAQIMKHWHWPPNFYDWPNIPDEVTGTSPQAEIDATAYLCREIGNLVGMDYCDGECSSGAPTEYMEGVFESRHYSSGCTVSYRSDVATAEEWFNGPGRIRDQINVNRPIQYRIVGHSIVCDGWQDTLQVHMNYGWDNGRDTWYSINGLHYPAGGTTDDEYMVKDIVPFVALSSPISGFYPTDFGTPYRYVDRDCSGNNATFQAGHKIQFLHEIKMVGAGLGVLFQSDAVNDTILYTKGNEETGICLKGGGLELKDGGEILFYH